MRFGGNSRPVAALTSTKPRPSMTLRSVPSPRLGLASMLITDQNPIRSLQAANCELVSRCWIRLTPAPADSRIGRPADNCTVCSRNLRQLGGKTNHRLFQKVITWAKSRSYKMIRQQQRPHYRGTERARLTLVAVRVFFAPTCRASSWSCMPARRQGGRKLVRNRRRTAGEANLDCRDAVRREGRRFSGSRPASASPIQPRGTRCV